MGLINILAALATFTLLKMDAPSQYFVPAALFTADAYLLGGKREIKDGIIKAGE